MGSMRPKNIHDFMRYSGIEDNVAKITNTIRGFKHTEGLPLIGDNRDKAGYTFFTRPLMNLTDRNLKNVSNLDKFLTDKALSIPRMARTLLDPRLVTGLINHKLYKQPALSSPLMIDDLAYMPILSNSLKNLSGWPSIKVPTYTSSPGLRKEQWAMVDGPYTVYDTFNLQATFKNITTEPIPTIMELWIRYPSLVYEGVLAQYLDVMWDFAKDYETSIYRFVTDESGRFIKKSARAVACFPDNEDTGKTFDYTLGRVYNDQLSDVSVNFVAQIAEYNESKTFLDFNKTTATFNPNVYLYLTNQPNNMEIIPKDLLHHFDNKGYPIIDLKTNELQWLIDKTDPAYAKIMNVLYDNREIRHYQTKNKIKV